MKSPVDSSWPWDGTLKSAIRWIVMEGAAMAGLRIEKLEDTSHFWEDESFKTPFLQHQMRITPGMISLRRGMYLYWLALASGSGDIVEVGSWQGRSTIALAQACADSNNGIVHAVDTFLGNPGNRKSYIIGSEDLSDLESNFLHNIERAGLKSRVITYAMSSVRAAPLISQATEGIRLLHIDGEHSYNSVVSELFLYSQLLIDGGLIVLDDYSPAFPGVHKAVQEFLQVQGERYGRPVQDKNLLVLKKLFP